MRPNVRFLVGLALTIVVCVGVALLWISGRSESSAPVTAVSCLGGSEKTELMADPQIKRILLDRYGLEVAYTPLGSYDLARMSTDELTSRGADCLWPSSASAQSVFEAQHPGDFPAYRAENLLQSPQVLYAGPKGTDALIKRGIVEERDRRFHIVDMKALLLDHVVKKQTWEDIGAADLTGPITVASTDPARSNSGFVLAQLELNILATDDVFTAPTITQARAALPTMRALHDAQGLQARGSEAGFREWLTQGGEYKSPLYAGYESQLIQQVVRVGPDAFRDTVRILYPDPTIYSDHPVLALDAEAAAFIDAMKDPEIQTIAWKTYGFRSAIQVGLSNVADFPDLALAATVRTTPPPSADVTLALLGCLTDASTCA